MAATSDWAPGSAEITPRAKARLKHRSEIGGFSARAISWSARPAKETTLKVTKRNPPPETALWKGTCRKCHSEAEATLSELKNVHSGDYRSDGPFAWEECPVCGAGKGTGFGGMLFYPTAQRQY